MSPSCRSALAVAVLSMTVTTAAALAAEPPDELLNSMSYRLVGPFRGGRVTAVAGVPGDPMTYYMGSTGGGVWKTGDAGLTWHNVSDTVRELEPKAAPAIMGDVEPALAAHGLLRAPAGGVPPEAAERRERRGGDAFGVGSIGAIAVAPSDPNVVWVGTGSACIRGNISPGDGVYRSTDAGDTWRWLGLPDAGQIGRIVVHPEDPDVAWVAALGHAFGPNPERGVYRTVDGGLSWTRVLHRSDRAGAVDLALDPGNPRVLYAATWEAQRSPWNAVSGGSGSGLFKSADGGTTWVELTDGLPEGVKGRIGVAVSPAAPQRVWALVEAEDGGLFRSDDGGESFRRVSAERELRQRAWYYTHVEADPQDANTVYVLNVMVWRSDDGGATFRPLRTPHGDSHALWINPDDRRNMIEGDDGGATISFDGGRSWSSQDNQPTAEMYRVTVDGQQPYWLYGGQQDNTAVAIPSRTADGAIGREHWYPPAGCESATVAVDPRDSAITYGGCYGGSITRYDRSLGQSEEIMAWPEMAVGRSAGELRHRFQWNAPILLSRHDPDVLYHGSNVVHRTADRGRTWQSISPDLTRNDPEKQLPAGGPITRDNTGVEVYGTIFALAESPHRPGLLWAGSDDGRVHVTEDGGGSWRDVTPPTMPEWGTVNAIELSAHDPNRAFLAVHRYRLDDFRPYLFRTDDLGASWTQLTDGSNGIPAGHFVRVVREDPERRGLLFAGGEFGIYASFDDGRTWRSLQLDLPVTPITDLAVAGSDLVVATQGRSYWILDDLSVLRRLADGVDVTTPHLFTPRPAIAWVDGAGGGRARGAVGQNPPFGAVIHYALPAGFDAKAEDAPEVVLEILDSDGEVIRRLSSTTPEPQAPSPWRRLFPELFEPPLLAARAGANRWLWNLRRADARLEDGTVLWGSADGPQVPPGTYGARLTVGSWQAESPVVVAPDPRVEHDAAAAAARSGLAVAIWRDVSRCHEALGRLRSVREQARAIAERSGDEAVDDAVTALVEALSPIEEGLTQPKLESSQDVLNFPAGLDNQLVYLQGMVESGAGAPTASAVERYAELESSLESTIAELDALIAARLPELERLIDAAGTPRIVVPPADGPDTVR